MQMKTRDGVEQQKCLADVDQDSVMLIVLSVVNYVTDIAVLLNSQSTAVRQNPFTLILLSQVFKGRVYLISNYLC